MIKVNYNPETGKVIAFGKDIEPYIEITEAARKQPLPNKYSWYAVEDGKFLIKSREPSAEEKAKDEAEAAARAEAAAKNRSLQARVKELEDALNALVSGTTELQGGQQE